MSEIFLSQVFRAATFGERPRQAADAHLLLLAGSQHRCSVSRADALKVCLRCVGIFFTGKTDRIKRVQKGYERVRDDHVARNIP